MDIQVDTSDLSPEAEQHLELAYTYDDKSDFVQALAECDSAIQLAPNWATAHNFRGVMLEELSRKEDAIKAYHEAVRLDPSHDEARENLLELEAELKEVIHGAGFWIRALARVIDLIVHSATAFIAGFLIVYATIIVAVVAEVSPDPLVQRLEGTSFIGYAIAVLGFIVYCTLCEGLHGATLGKLTCGLVVVKDDGSTCSLSAALRRTLAFFIDSLFFGLIAAVNMRKSPKRQRVGDEWASTVVAKRRDLQPAQLRSGCRFVIVFLGALILYGLILSVSLLLKLVG